MKKLPVPLRAVLEREYVIEQRTEAEMARLHGVGVTTVSRWLRAAAIPRRWPRGERPAPETLRQLYIDERMSLAAIGEHFGVALQTVRRWLIDGGVELRTSAEGLRLYLSQLPHEEHLRRTAASRAVILARRRERS
jgi:hypothetical protein